ncbi:MAG: serine/threonine protein kinase, partial [Cyanobacteria bacterium]|nr:serine/threonine protein kinase [Cyanobacteria bacterium CG_2015-09_32_10]
MIISYCVNPSCSQPKNHPKLKKCNTCGSSLILNNRYRVIKMLGKGGFGATFVGVDLTVVGDPLCVVKQLRPMADDPQALKTAISLFEREAKTLGKISHPQIPKLMNYFADQGQFYLIQELINGQNLQREVKTQGVYGEIALRRFLEEITPILKYLHSEKVIHRDIKPANILRQKKDGKLVLIDFGAVKDQVNTQLAKTFGQTALTKFSVGTMGYAPPEQL